MFSSFMLFFLKLLAVFVFLLLLMMMFGALKAKNKPTASLNVKNLNEKYEKYKEGLAAEIYNKDELKNLKKTEKARKGENKKDKKTKSRLFVLNFSGDLKASRTDNLREEISSLLIFANREDEILVNLDTGGGYVANYGFAAAQLARIKSRGMKLTVSIDRIAASGGYLMASVADKIIASPFAIVGSIGVVGQLPNFNKFLKKHDIEFEQLTAGKYKRTLTMFGENSKEAREKFQEDLNVTHDLFKNFVALHRPKVDIEQVSTGEYWYGKNALALNLVDELITSDDYLLQRKDEYDIYEISYEVPQKMITRILQSCSILRNKLPIFC